MSEKTIIPRILVVDDDPGIRHLIWSVLRHHGFSVTVAHNPSEARLRLQSERFEMLVTDHDMPRETGLSFVNELRSGSLAMGSNKTDIPVVMVSAKAEPDHVDAVRKAGIQALVQKPFLPTAFVQLLNDIVSSKRSGDFICLSTLN